MKKKSADNSYNFILNTIKKTVTKKQKQNLNDSWKIDLIKLKKRTSSSSKSYYQPESIPIALHQLNNKPFVCLIYKSIVN